MYSPLRLYAIFIFAILSCPGVWSVCSKKPSVDSNTNNVTFQDLEKYTVKSNLSESYEAKGLQPFFNLAKSFMNTVQPKSFGEFIKDKNQDEVKRLFGEDWRQLVKGYELPIIICVGIGLLFAIIMPITGFCFCCCRCCKKCGGDMKQSDKSARQHCKLSLFILILFIFTVLMLCGVLFMFVTNNRLNDAYGDTIDTYEKTRQVVEAIKDAIIKQIKWLIDDQVICILGLVKDGIGDQKLKADIGEPLKQEVKQNVSKPLDLGLEVSNSVIVILHSLYNVTAGAKKLVSDAEKLEGELNTTQDNLDEIVKECKQQNSSSDVCGELEKVKLKIQIDFESLPDVTKYSDEVKTISEKNLEQYIEKARKLVDDIPNIVVNKSKDGVDKINKQIDDSEKELSAKGTEFTDKLDEVYDSVNPDGLDDQIKDLTNYSNKYESIRWKVYIGISALMAFIVLLLFCGLACGSCGYKKDYMPTERSTTSNCGGDFLMAAVGFMFIFAIILMIICTAWFAVGMHTHILCRGLKDGKFIDDVIVKVFKPFGDDADDLKISEILANCRKDASLYKATSYIEKKFKIKEKMREQLDEIKDEVKKSIDEMDFNMKDQKILSQETKDAIDELLNSDVKNIDFASFYQKLNESITSQNLTEILSNLTKLGDRSGNSQLSQKIKELAVNLTRIKDTTVKALTSEMSDTTSLLKKLENEVISIMDDGKYLLDLLESSQKFIEGTEPDIKKLIKKLADKLIDQIKQGLEHLITQIEDNFGNCRPIAGIYDGVVNAFFCGNVIQNSNGFWLALGWCLLFFIPSIIFAVKIAKYFRRMDYTSGMDTIEVDHPPYNEKMHSDRPPPYSQTQHSNPGYQHM